MISQYVSFFSDLRGEGEVSLSERTKILCRITESNVLFYTVLCMNKLMHKATSLWLEK